MDMRGTAGHNFHNWVIFAWAGGVHEVCVWLMTKQPFFAPGGMFVSQVWCPGGGGVLVRL